MLTTIVKERHKQLAPEKPILPRSDQFCERRTPGKITTINGSNLGFLRFGEPWICFPLMLLQVDETQESFRAKLAMLDSWIPVYRYCITAKIRLNFNSTFKTHFLLWCHEVPSHGKGAQNSFLLPPSGKGPQPHKAANAEPIYLKAGNSSCLYVTSQDVRCVLHHLAARMLQGPDLVGTLCFTRAKQICGYCIVAACTYL